MIDNQPTQDDEESSFLRQKKDELNQKRQDKLKEKESVAVTPIDKPSAAGDAASAVSLPLSVADIESTSTVLVPESITPLPGASQLPQKIDADVTSENVSAPSSSELQKIRHVTDDASQKLPVSTAATASVSEAALPSPPPVSAARVADTLTTDHPSDGGDRVHTQLPKPTTGSGAKIPLFYFPMGQPSDLSENEMLLQRVKDEFDKVEEGKITKAQMGLIVKVLG